jgi:transcriptional regulator with XRE-family HTH domain
MYRDDLLRAGAAAARLTILDIEKKTGINRNTIAKIMNGDPKGTFALHRLHTIAQMVGVPMPKLFEAPVEQAGNLPSVPGSV